VWFGYSKDLLSDFRSARGSVAKLFPVVKPAARDDVVNCGKRPVGVIQVTVQHAPEL